MVEVHRISMFTYLIRANNKVFGLFLMGDTEFYMYTEHDFDNHTWPRQVILDVEYNLRKINKDLREGRLGITKNDKCSSSNKK